jgi:hypothetical protein
VHIAVESACEYPAGRIADIAIVAATIVAAGLNLFVLKAPPSPLFCLVAGVTQVAVAERTASE